MDSAEFRRRGKALIDMIADYHETIAQRRVSADVKPGYLRKLIPEDPPKDSEPWDNVISDVETAILPGITHWAHPNFFAYFPVGSSFPSILGEILCAGIAANGFSWLTSPAITELETIVLDWVARMVGLPAAFQFFGEGSSGGGVLQSSASDCIFVSMLAARDRALKDLHRVYSTTRPKILLDYLVAYCSKESHSSIEKAANIALVKLRVLDTDDAFQLRGQTVSEAMEEDIKKGFHPFFVFVTIGTTSSGSCDVIREIGPVCERRGVWLHVDASYAGSALICPEYRPLLQGISYAMSFNMTPSKWMLVSLECCAMWVKDRFRFIESFAIEPSYLQHEKTGKVTDFRNWGISLSHRFRALKLWFTIRSYGVARLQKYIRNHCSLAKMFERFVRLDSRFEVKNNVWFGLVCFRLVGSNTLNQKLLRAINNSGLLLVTQTTLNNEFVIRFCLDYEYATEGHVINAWETIQNFADAVLEEGENED